MKKSNYDGEKGGTAKGVGERLMQCGFIEIKVEKNHKENNQMHFNGYKFYIH